MGKKVGETVQGRKETRKKRRRKKKKEYRGRTKVVRFGKDNKRKKDTIRETATKRPRDPTKVRTNSLRPRWSLKKTHRKKPQICERGGGKER